MQSRGISRRTYLEHLVEVDLLLLAHVLDLRESGLIVESNAVILALLVLGVLELALDKVAKRIAELGDERVGLRTQATLKSEWLAAQREEITRPQQMRWRE